MTPESVVAKRHIATSAGQLLAVNNPTMGGRPKGSKSRIVSLVCEVCGSAFTAGVITARYCHNNCGSRARRRGVFTKAHINASGLYRLPEFGVWMSMRSRCSNADDPDYGGRGIRVCDRWEDSFENFLADMGPRPSPKHSIDRIDVNGNYEPGNVRWATAIEQQRNRRNTVRVLVAGRTVSLCDLSEETGLPMSTLRRRYRSGWSGDSMVAPKKTALKKERKVAFSGRELSVTEWSNETGIPWETIHTRLVSGWSVERTLTTPNAKRDVGKTAAAIALLSSGRGLAWKQIAAIVGCSESTVRVAHLFLIGQRRPDRPGRQKRLRSDQKAPTAVTSDSRSMTPNPTTGRSRAVE